MEKKKKLNLKKVKIAKLSNSKLDNIRGGGESCAFSAVTIITIGSTPITAGATCNGYDEAGGIDTRNCPTS